MPGSVQFSLILALAALLSACGKKSSGGGDSGPASVQLTQDDDVSLRVELADRAEIIAFGRQSKNILHASASNGVGYTIDLEKEKVETATPFSKFDNKTTTTFTVSDAYVWLLFSSENQVGRNKVPPDSNGKFEVTKVSLDEVIGDVAELTPLAATDDQLYLVSDEDLVVCTFAGQSVNLKKVPLPAPGLLKKEEPLGAGPIGDVEDDNGFWFATTKRLLVLDNRGNSARWQVENLFIEYDDDPPLYLALYYHLDSKKIEQTGKIIGLFNKDTINDLDLPKSK